MKYHNKFANFKTGHKSKKQNVTITKTNNLTLNKISNFLHKTLIKSDILLQI